MNLSLDFDAVPQPAKAFKRPTITCYDEGDRYAPRVPKYSAIKVCDFHNGIKDYCTTRKSFISVEGPLLKKLPVVFRKKWFAELVDSVVVLYFLYDELREIAVQLELQQTGSSGAYGALNYLYNHSKDEVLAYLLSCPVRAARFDFEYNIHRNLDAIWPSSTVEGVVQQAEYRNHLSQLRLPKPSLFQRLEHGMKIRFSKPLTFRIQGGHLSVSDFQVVKDGRKLRFVSTEHGFLAQITGADQMDYAII